MTTINPIDQPTTANLTIPSLRAWRWKAAIFAQHQPGMGRNSTFDWQKSQVEFPPLSQNTKNIVRLSKSDTLKTIFETSQKDDSFTLTATDNGDSSVEVHDIEAFHKYVSKYGKDFEDAMKAVLEATQNGTLYDVELPSRQTKASNLPTLSNRKSMGEIIGLKIDGTATNVDKQTFAGLSETIKAIDWSAISER